MVYLTVSAVRLVAYQDLDDVFTGMRLDLFEPVLQRLECLAIINGVGHNDAHSAFVVGLSDGFEAFLSGSVPNLHTNLLAVDFDCLDLEINAFLN